MFNVKFRDLLSSDIFLRSRSDLLMMNFTVFLIIDNRAHQNNEKSSNSAIYQTLARRGRRSSVNNVRRLYEDSVNLRRVRQFMKEVKEMIIMDEDKLMEMSKQVESQNGKS